MVPTSKLVIIAAVACTIILAVHRLRESPSQLQQESVKSNLPSDPSYSLAREDSLGFFDDIENSDWVKIRNQSRSEPLFKNPDDPDTGFSSLGRWMFENVDPILACPRQLRLGGRGDGAKWACDPHRLIKANDDCLIYSVGCGGIYDFEDALFNMFGKKCEIHVFDPEPSYKRKGDTESKNIHYHTWGLKSSYAPPPKVKYGECHTIQETMEKLGHVGRRIDIFKIDCEGCEWTSYHDWISDSLDIRQLLIEIHISDQVNNVSISGFFKDLTSQGFVPFSKQANAAYDPAGHYFEYAFLRMKPSFYLQKDE